MVTVRKIFRRQLPAAPNLVVCLLLVLFGEIGHAQSRLYSLVCFERSGLTRSLNVVVNPQQFLRNGSILRNGSCDFAQVPSGSTARFSGFHQTENGFIFPLFKVTYATTGQRMYAADGIFLAEHWRIAKHCGDRSRGANCLYPNSCDVLDGFVLASAQALPDYVFVPARCRTFAVE